MQDDPLAKNLIAQIDEEERRATAHEEQARFHRDRAQKMREFLDKLPRSTHSESMPTTLPTLNVTKGLDQLKPAEAVRRLIESTPGKAWTANEIYDSLIKLRDEGRLMSKAVELLASVYTILKRMDAKRIIKKVEIDGETRYVFPEKPLKS